MYEGFNFSYAGLYRHDHEAPDVLDFKDLLTWQEQYMKSSKSRSADATAELEHLLKETIMEHKVKQVQIGSVEKSKTSGRH
jgi:hypothetical protein